MRPMKRITVLLADDNRFVREQFRQILELMRDTAKASEAVVAEMDSASILETIRVRESTLMTAIDKTLHFRASSCWAINQ